MVNMLMIAKDSKIHSTVRQKIISEQVAQIQHIPHYQVVALLSKQNNYLVILDASYIGERFLEYLSEIRSLCDSPTLLLADGEEQLYNVIRYGLDDFLIAPYTEFELYTAIVGMVTRHSDILESKIIAAGELTINLLDRTVCRDKTPIRLTGKEFDLLVMLAQHKGQVFTRRQIYMQIWGNDYDYDDRNIMSFMSKMRKKIEPDDRSPHYILTEWGVGYRFNREP